MRPIDLYAAADRASEQLINQNAQRLGADIPERHFDGRVRALVHSARHLDAAAGQGSDAMFGIVIGAPAVSALSIALTAGRSGQASRLNSPRSVTVVRSLLLANRTWHVAIRQSAATLPAGQDRSAIEGIARGAVAWRARRTDGSEAKSMGRLLPKSANSCLDSTRLSPAGFPSICRQPSALQRRD